MSQNEQAPYVRTQEYTSMPRYSSGVALNPTLCYFNDDNEDDNGVVFVDKKLFSPATHQLAEGDFIPPGFFSRAHLDGFTRRFNTSQWSYEMRREAQPILPFLSLGPSACLRDREALHNQGFTLLLAIRNTHSAQARLFSGDKVAAELGIQSDTIDVLDNQELISAFPRAIRRINDHLASMDVHDHGDVPAVMVPTKKKVLVFCESGNERSAGVVIAYIMAMLNHDTMHATRMVQQRRFCVSIEDPLKRVLTAFESILVAKRDVECAKCMATQSGVPNLAPQPVSHVLLARKRSFQYRRAEDVEMDDGVMDVDGDEDLLPERKPVAPFQDRVV